MAKSPWIIEFDVERAEARRNELPPGYKPPEWWGDDIEYIHIDPALKGAFQLIVGLSETMGFTDEGSDFARFMLNQKQVPLIVKEGAEAFSMLELKRKGVAEMIPIQPPDCIETE